ncbi:LAQU0S04e04038g1_1 [Lachancea quebecensis]|uniref:LAQU0S04e04038g1_1 n=1 Tax=Lachancea quebecensis TaxID=1654605 RepID=A0A0P1KPH4_9SACH|nr:LAQU0S04e04038g1_1 [Lachancea quebecensis]
MDYKEKDAVPKIPERPKKPVPAIPIKRPVRTRTTGALHQVPSVPLARPQRRHTEKQLNTVMQATQDQLEQMKTMISKPMGRTDRTSTKEETMSSNHMYSPAGSSTTSIGRNEHEEFRVGKEIAASISPGSLMLGELSVGDEDYVKQSSLDTSEGNEQESENELETTLAEEGSRHSAQNPTETCTEEPETLSNAVKITEAPAEELSEPGISETSSDPSNKTIEKSSTTVDEKLASSSPKKPPTALGIEEESPHASKPSEQASEIYCTVDPKEVLRESKLKGNELVPETKGVQGVNILQDEIEEIGKVDEFSKKHPESPAKTYESSEQLADTKGVKIEPMGVSEFQVKESPQASLVELTNETDMPEQNPNQESVQPLMKNRELGSETKSSASGAKSSENQTDENEVSPETIKGSSENVMNDANNPLTEHGTPNLAGKLEYERKTLKLPVKERELVDCEEKKTNEGTSNEGHVSQSSEVGAPQIPQRPSKRPPPKKPSSKIAAFQALLKQQQLNDVSKTKDKQIDSGNSLLSGKRANITSNLNGIFGLPGMTSGTVPSQRPLARQQPDSDGDTQGSKPLASSQGSTPPGTQRRTRGPKGRKLPAHIANVEKVETSMKTNEIQVVKTWSLQFQKATLGYSRGDNKSFTEPSDSGLASSSTSRSMSEASEVLDGRDVIGEREVADPYDSQNDLGGVAYKSLDDKKELSQSPESMQSGPVEADGDQESR